jgi:nicotinamidase-related amidase
VELPRKTIPVIQDAIDFAHGKNIAVIFTKQIHVPEAFAAGLHSALGREMSALREANVQFCMKDSEGAELISELVPAKGDYVIEKNKASAFYNTWLDIWLRYRKIRTLLIAGCSTGYCVAHTIMDAWARDFDTIAMRDCIGDAYPFVQENLLALFDMRWGRVMNWKDVRSSLS